LTYINLSGNETHNPNPSGGYAVVSTRRIPISPTWVLPSGLSNNDSKLLSSSAITALESIRIFPRGSSDSSSRRALVPSRK
jgi:hypothetical protein